MKLFVKQPQFIFFYLDRARKYSNTAAFDTFIISYPKSGRTWLQKLIIEALALKNKIDIESSDISNLKEKIETAPYILSTHAGSSWEEIVLDENEINENDWDKYSHGKIIFLVRDPRDVLVSQYHHITKRSNFPDFPKAELINNKNVGIVKLINFMNKWIKVHKTHPKNCLLISYEMLKTDPQDTLIRLFQFLDIEMDDKYINLAIEKCSIAKMQKEESNQKTPWSYTPYGKNKDAFQSRKGKIGDHKDFFNNIEIDSLNKLINDQLTDEFSYYKTEQIS